MKYKRYYATNRYEMPAQADSCKDQPSNQKLGSHDQTDHQLLKQPGTMKGVTDVNG